VPASGGYDGAGNRLSLSANVPATAYTGAVSGTVQDSYDGRDQVVGETSTRSNASYDAPFQYDGVTSGTSTGPGNPTDMRGNSQAFNGDNQITGTGYAYDGDGNPVTYKSNALHFDPEGRMTAYGTAETNTYTGDGLRASRNAGGVNYYLYDGETLLAQLNSDGSLNGVMTFGADGLVSQRSVSGSNSLYYDFDLSGNVSQRWQSVGSVGQSEGFDGFGRRYLATGGDCFTGFTSQWGGYYDSATSGDGGQTGLTLLTHRFYDPSVGRFLTRDPLGYEGGINLYAYTDNNPLNEDDPSGEQAVQGVVVLAGGAYLAGLALYEYLQWLRLHPIIIEPGPGWNPFPKPAPTPPPVSPTSRNINSPRQLGLPTTGQFPYVPPKKWRPGKGLPTDPGGNPIDKNGRPWVKGPNHHFPNESCEWDVQDPDTGKHWNVGGDSGSTK
jgi:RHS repeat-associated protein